MWKSPQQGDSQIILQPKPNDRQIILQPNDVKLSGSDRKWKSPQQGDSQIILQPNAVNLSVSDSKKPHDTYTQTAEGENNQQIQAVDEIATGGTFNMGTKPDKFKQGDSQNNPQPKDVKSSRSDSKEHSQQPHTTHNQIGGGTHNQQLQGVGKIAANGTFNMG